MFCAPACNKWLPCPTIADMKNSLCMIASFLTGAVISLMVVANTRLGSATTNEVSMIVNQAIGVVLTTVILVAGRKSTLINPPRRPSRWYMYFGGLFGVVVMICNFYSVLGVGATMAMAAAVFGQSLMGLLMDLFGLFGMQKRKTGGKKWISVAVSFAGILMMVPASESPASLAYILLGILAGIVTMIQLSYNSSFARAKGAVYSARQNALSGLLGTVIYSFLLMRDATCAGFARLPEVPLMTAALGGVLAIVVVCSTNLIIPKIPALYSSLLLSTGQILASIVLDAAMYDIFSPMLLAGAIVMLAGIALSFLFERSQRPVADR